ncbi:DUF1064 domain-containing protein [Hydrogenophaga sp.]|uniref:DUF1064 domain-containing protein n=1 Tax=Hydrogenophaga sp. TaxID=1904254 RepID=UPI0025BF2FF0|nr:DUF1064 domain-containing protein [Hydrogenophaga sp.]MBT9463537.1 DUF1064 domain-containing protein [Hydrogenophaga sp.]
MDQPAAEPAKRASKYGNQKTVVDGITFDSKAEVARWVELKTMERAGLITHPRAPDASSCAKAIADELTENASVIVIPKSVDAAVVVGNGATPTAGAFLVVITATSPTCHPFDCKEDDKTHHTQNKERFHFVPLSFVQAPLRQRHVLFHGERHRGHRFHIRQPLTERLGLRHIPQSQFVNHFLQKRVQVRGVPPLQHHHLGAADAQLDLQEIAAVNAPQQPVRLFDGSLDRSVVIAEVCNGHIDFGQIRQFRPLFRFACY